MLEIRHLRTLIALAESGSVSRAAERLHLTQSALSHQLRALESHYGLAVVRRKGQTVALSEAGERLLELAHKVVADIQTAERDLERIKGRAAGTLRIALECHTCFDWLMPVMDAFRQRWPEVELDLVSGFHADPLALLKEGRADVVIGSERKPRQGVVFAPLFRFEILAVLPVDHPLRSRKWLEAKDFADQTLITYPVPEERIDLIRQVLAPAGIAFTRRTTELTIAVLQLVVEAGVVWPHCRAGACAATSITNTWSPSASAARASGAISTPPWRATMRRRRSRRISSRPPSRSALRGCRD